MEAEDPPAGPKSWKCQLGSLSRADGSCMLSQGGTHVWVAVNGPGNANTSRRLADKMAVSVNFHPLFGDSRYPTFENLVMSAVGSTVRRELFPRTELAVTIHELQNDGSLMAVALNATSLALLDSEVPSEAPFCAVEVARTPTGDYYVNPAKRHEAAAEGLAVLVFRSHETDAPTLIAKTLTGQWTPEQLKEGIERAGRIVPSLFMSFKMTLQERDKIEIFGNWKKTAN
ncbi:unnamed protein product, partial [Mesorhabditis spiculigera]